MLGQGIHSAGFPVGYVEEVVFPVGYIGEGGFQLVVSGWFWLRVLRDLNVSVFGFDLLELDLI